MRLGLYFTEQNAGNGWQSAVSLMPAGKVNNIVSGYQTKQTQNRKLDFEIFL